MPVRTGGSWLLDPITGDLTPNPADEAAQTIPEAQPAANAEGQQAQPGPGTDALSSDAGAQATEAGSAPASDPPPETGEALEAAPAAASNADFTSSGRRAAKKDS